MHEPFKPVGYRPAPPPAPSRSRWRWAFGGVLLIFGLLAGLVLIGPSLVDWNAWKGPLAEAVRRATGRELAIAGDLSLELLPRPRLVARTVSLGNAAEGSAQEMVRVDRLEARLAPWPLLTGRLELRSLDLLQPTILLERLPDGTWNWESAIQHLSEARRQGSLTLALEQVWIGEGTATWRSADGSERTVQSLEAALTQSAQGQIAIAGSGEFAKTPLRFESTLFAGSEGGPLSLLIAAGEGEAELSGVLTRGERPLFTGRLRLASPSPARTLEALGLVEGPAQAGLDQRLAAEAELKLEGPRIETTQLRIEFGGAVAGGKAELDLDARKAAVELSMSRLDLDAWPKNDAPWPRPTLPRDWSAAAKLAVEALVWNGGIISQVRAAARMEDGKIALDEAKALLPGGSEVGIVAALEPADAGRWRWTGRLTAASDNVRGLLQWLDAEPGGVPADRLRKLTMKARLSGAGQTVQVSEIDAMLDSSHVTGGVTAVLRARPGFGVGLAIDELNLDAYRPREPAAGTEEPGAAQNPLARFDSNFNLAIAQLTYGGQRLQAVRAEGTLQNGDLALKQLSARTPSGGSARLAGGIAGAAGKEPQLALEIDLAAKDGAELVRLVGLPDPEAKLGAMSLSGTAAGKSGAVAVDVSILSEGYEADGKLTGTLAALRPALRGSGKVQANLRNPARLAPLLDLDPKRLGGLGRVAVAGEIVRDADRLTADLTLSAPDPKLTAAIAGTRTGEGEDAALEARFEATAEKGRPILIALGLDPADLPEGAVSANLTASGPLREIAVDGSAAALEGQVTVRGRLSLAERRSYQLALGAEHPDLPKLAAAFGVKAEPLAGALAVNGTVEGDGERAEFALKSARLGPITASGTGEVAFLEPRLRARLSLALGEVPLAVLVAPFRTRGGDATVGAGWSTRPIDFALLARIDAEASLTADAATLGIVRADQVKATLALTEGKLALRMLEGDIGQGRWAASGLLEPAARDTASLSLSLQGAEIGETPEWAGFAWSGGKLALGLEVTSRGTSAAELVQGLAGTGRISIEGGVLRGLDLAAMSALAKADAPPADAAAVATSLGQGDTPVTKLETGIAVERGVLTASDLAMVTPAATGRGTLSLDLLAWEVDGKLEATAVERPELPAVQIGIGGPVNAPQRTLDAEALAAALAPEPEPEPAPEPEEPVAVPVDPAQPAPAQPAQPAPSQPAQPAPPQPTQPAPPPPAPAPSAVQPAPAPPAAPAAEPEPQPGADVFVKGILEKLKKPAQP